MRQPAALMILAVSAVAMAAPKMQLEDAIKLYDAAKFGEARSAFDSIVADPTTVAADQDQARLYLAAIFVAAKDTAAARAQVVAVLRDKPANYAIDPVVFPPELVAMAVEIRSEQAQVRENTPPPIPTVAPPDAPPPVVGVVAEPPSPPGRSQLFWLPVGIGAVATVTGAVMLSLASDRHAQLTGPNKVPNAEHVRDAGNTYQTVGWLGVGVGAAALGTGVVMFLLGGSLEKNATALVSPAPGGMFVGVQGVFP